MRVVLFLILCLVGIPIAYMFSVAKPVIRKDSRGVILSLLFFAVTGVTAGWAIDQSRSDWASMLYFALPFEAALAGLLALMFGRRNNFPTAGHRALGWVALVFATLIVVFNVSQGDQNIAGNRADDAFDELHYGQSTRDRDLINAALQQNPGREQAWLDGSIRERMQDTIFLAAALGYDPISPGLLDTLSRSPFQDVALGAVLNDSTPGAALAKSYREHPGSDLFVHALAANHHTPPDILREIYRRPHNSSGIEISLAANPFVPRDILRGLAGSAANPETINTLLRRKSLDCPLLREIASYLAGKGKPLARDYNVIPMNELMPKICPDSIRK